jgi:anti-sigma factor RsiW
MMTCPISHELLSAYVDSELPADTARSVADHLTSCARCSADYETLLDTVSALRAGLTRHTAPDVLRARIRGTIAAEPLGVESFAASIENPRAWSRGWRAAATATAAIVGLALGSGGTMLALRGTAARSPVEEQVLASHVRSLMPDHLTDIRSSDQHNVKPWFNGRLDFSPSVPRLDDAGFPLLGGRLDYVADRPVASVVYARRQHIINVFSWPTPAADAPLESTASHGYTMLHWCDHGVEQWAVSDLNAKDLRAFVDLLRRAELANADSEATR